VLNIYTLTIATQVSSIAGIGTLIAVAFICTQIDALTSTIGLTQRATLAVGAGLVGYRITGPIALAAMRFAGLGIHASIAAG